MDMIGGSACLACDDFGRSAADVEDDDLLAGEGGRCARKRKRGFLLAGNDLKRYAEFGEGFDEIGGVFGVARRRRRFGHDGDGIRAVGLQGRDFLHETPDYGADPVDRLRVEVTRLVYPDSKIADLVIALQLFELACGADLCDEQSRGDRPDVDGRIPAFPEQCCVIAHELTFPLE